MANSCLNTLRLSGQVPNVSAAREFFKDLRLREEAGMAYHLPGFIVAENRDMWDIGFEQDSIIFKTKWQPNLEALQQIADHFGIGFSNHYVELNCYIYGEAIYDRGLLTNIVLTATDFASYEYDFQNRSFHMNGRSFDWEEEVIAVLLENKKRTVLDNLAKTEQVIIDHVSAGGPNISF